MYVHITCECTHVNTKTHIHIHIHTLTYKRTFALIQMIHTATYAYSNSIYLTILLFYRYKAKLKHQEKLMAQLEQDHTTALVSSFILHYRTKCIT